ncbi:MAG: tetratricopeptide repeat protein [Bacteroidaceae bacterium]|nr:tetratricopeptide repeat protein [Bacteroidaceae bacterium]MBQ8008737.1 tetratricopeptide repeat protein [Bacteroidaceae bacterium]MBR1541974.1 tetratricopeptide repeat protein [Bacteroidaceae bacterium]
MAKRNPLSDSEKRLNNLARKYETLRAEGESVYMEPDDFADLCSWYDNNYYPDKGDEVMEYALSIYPESTMLKIEQAYRYLDRGDSDQAEIMADQIEDDFTGDLQILKARLMIEREEFEVADDYLNSFPADKLDPILVANMYLDTHFSEKAITWLKIHGQGMEEDEDYLSILVSAYCYLGKYSEAIEVCEKLIDKDPFSAHYWLSLGRCYLALGEYNKALDACDFSITNDEDLGDAYLTRCNLYALVGNEEKAQENLKQAIRLNAVIKGDMNEFDLALLLDQARVEDAIRLMEFYLKHIDQTQDQRLNTYFRLGVCYNHLLWYKQAMSYFDMILAVRPGDKFALMQKAAINLSQEDFDNALHQLQQAVDANPDDRKFLYRMMGVVSLIMKQYDDFRHFSAMSDAPLTEEEIRQSIQMIEQDEEEAVKFLLEGLKNNFI